MPVIYDKLSSAGERAFLIFLHSQFYHFSFSSGFFCFFFFVFLSFPYIISPPFSVSLHFSVFFVLFLLSLYFPFLYCSPYPFLYLPFLSPFFFSIFPFYVFVSPHVCAPLFLSVSILYLWPFIFLPSSTVTPPHTLCLLGFFFLAFSLSTVHSIL